LPLVKVAPPAMRVSSASRGRTPVELIIEPQEPEPTNAPQEAVEAPPSPSRRWWVVGAAALGIVTLGWWWTHRFVPTASQLVVSSTPSGGRVEVDGTEVGVTPWAGDVSLTRAHDVVVSMSGYTNFKMTVDAGVSTSIEANLKRR
jgi:ferric-dicitrate binding protein FerR (iron transport regulator)